MTTEAELDRETYRPGLDLVFRLPDERPRAVILFFHGGGFFAGQPEQFLHLWPSLLAQNIACASAAYRVKAKHNSSVYDSIEDATAATDFILSKLAGVPVFLAGASAGGTLALLASRSRDIRGCLLFNPVLDLSVNGFKNKATPPGGDVGISPLDLAPLVKFPPTLIMQGDEDAVVPLDTAHRYSSIAGAELIVFEKSQHGFLHRHDLTERIIEAMERFMAPLLNATPLAKEAEFFSAIDNKRVRDAGWSSVPHINGKILKEIDVRAEALKCLAGKSDIRALTLACGDMTGEYAFLKGLGATQIDAYDISEGQRAKFFAKYDREVPVSYKIADVNTLDLPAQTYHVVYMQQSLHHIENIERLLGQIHDALTDDGIFVLIDYVGEPFLQRTAKQREIGQKIWQHLPDRLRVNASGKINKALHIPSKDSLSPYEAVRSDVILPSLKNIFFVEKMFLYAGLLFPILNGFAFNYDERNENDVLLIKLLWELDRILIDNGALEPNFVRGIFRKRTNLK